MRITGIQVYDYAELQRIKKLVLKNAQFSRTLTSSDRMEAFRRTMDDMEVYKKNRLLASQTYSEILVDFPAMDVAHMGKVIYICFI